MNNYGAAWLGQRVCLSIASVLPVKLFSVVFLFARAETRRLLDMRDNHFGECTNVRQEQIWRYCTAVQGNLPLHAC